MTRGEWLYACRLAVFPMQFDEGTAGERPRRTWLELPANEREGWESTARLYDAARRLGLIAGREGEILYGMHLQVSPKQWREYEQAYVFPRPLWPHLSCSEQSKWGAVAQRYARPSPGAVIVQQAWRPLTATRRSEWSRWSDGAVTYGESVGDLNALAWYDVVFPLPADLKWVDTTAAVEREEGQGV